MMKPNSLASKSPELAKQVHPTLNYFDPEEIGPIQEKKLIGYALIVLMVQMENGKYKLQLGFPERANALLAQEGC